MYFYYNISFIQTLLNAEEQKICKWTVDATVQSYCGLCNVVERCGNTDDHTQFNHNILVIKFWKRSLKGGKFYYNLHNQVERGTRLCLTFVCLKFSGWGMQEGLTRVPGISWAAGRAHGGVAPAWGSAGDPGVAAVLLCHCHCPCQDRLELEAAARQRGAHHILPAWQGARHKQGAQSWGWDSAGCASTKLFLDELMQGKHD